MTQHLLNQKHRLFPGFSQQAHLRVTDWLAILVSMSNMYEGTSANDMPTAPYRSGPGKGRWSRGKRAAALLAVTAAVGGGAFVAVDAATGSPAAAPTGNAQTMTALTGTQAGSSASVAGQATALRDVLTTKGIHRLARLRALGGMYGQYTYENKSGSHTFAFERGTITAVGTGDVVIRAANGTTWTWVLTSTSVVRETGKKEPESTLATGQAVFAGGPVTSGDRDARIIVIRKARATAKTSGTE
jgi:hypothetical protein